MGQLQMVHADIDEKTSGKYAGYRLGTQLWAKLTNDLRLTFEPSYIFTEHFDRNDGRVRYDQMDYKLGLTMLFRGKSHRNTICSLLKTTFLNMDFLWVEVLVGTLLLVNGDMQKKNVAYF